MIKSSKVSSKHQVTCCSFFHLAHQNYVFRLSALYLSAPGLLIHTVLVLKTKWSLNRSKRAWMNGNNLSEHAPHDNAFIAAHTHASLRLASSNNAIEVAMAAPSPTRANHPHPASQAPRTWTNLNKTAERGKISFLCYTESQALPTHPSI